MRVGIVFHKNPLGLPAGIDLVRLRAVSLGLFARGVEVEIIAPVAGKSLLHGAIPVFPLAVLGEAGRYDVVKTCYHFSIRLLGKYGGPVVSRIVRVVDDRLPERDLGQRDELLRCQDIISRRAGALVMNNRENEDRWRALYGPHLPVTLIPSGCPVQIPPPRSNPFAPGEKAMLFLGSVAAPRMVRLMNEASRLLRGRCSLHLVGVNKAKLYGGGANDLLSPDIVEHGEMAEERTWDFIRSAHVGLALAAGPETFDNDLSKIYGYLRGGLPVLSEEGVLNNWMVLKSGLGRIFGYGAPEDLAAQAFELLEHPPVYNRKATMEWMAREHSWDNRVENLGKLLVETANAVNKVMGLDQFDCEPRIEPAIEF
jgi:hypothetical protein